MFPKGIRSQYEDLLTILHYPNQLLIASNRKYAWRHERKREERYVMKYAIRGVERLKGRSTPNRPCNENWEDYDNEIKKNSLRPPIVDLPILI